MAWERVSRDARRGVSCISWWTEFQVSTWKQTNVGQSHTTWEAAPIIEKAE